MPLEQLVGTVAGFLYDKILAVLLIAVGLYFTVRLKGVQFNMFGEAIRVVGEKTKSTDSISSFQALMVSTASRVGTGNIVGVTTAICLGGFGSVFWMWLIAVIGCASAFVESTLAQIYKKRSEGDDGTSRGGPAYYIQQGLHSRGLGIVFSILLLCTFGCGFIMLASYNLVDSFKVYFGGGEKFYAGPVPIVIGAVTALLFALCIFGGGKKIAKVTGVMVPVMGVVYIVVALAIILTHITLIPQVFARIFREAFDFTAIFGGLTGSCLMYGIKRGLFSNEAGLGSAPNAAAAADVAHPAKQGLVQVLSVFLDTIVICSATALMCMCSGIEPSAELAGIAYVQEAVAGTFGYFGYLFVTFSMVMFAFSTLLGNCFYAEPNLKFILQRDLSKGGRIAFYLIETLFVFTGAFLEFGLVWNLADLMMAVMSLVNLPVIVVLGKKAFDCLDDYKKQKREGKEPVFRAEDIGISGTDYWQ